MKLYINDEIFANFEKYVIDLKYNAIASIFKFDALRDILPVQLSYSSCKVITDDDELLLTGVILSSTRSISARPELISVSGYSSPGVLEDCNIPTSMYPLQSDNLSLKQICEKILPEFSIDFSATDNVQEDFEKTYKKANANINQTIKSFLNSIASQGGMIVSHNKEGHLVFTKIDTDIMTPVATFEEGNGGNESITLDVNGQVLHSEITVVKQASELSRSSGEETVLNPMVSAYRPRVKVSNSGSVFDVKKAARMELSKELSSIRFSIRTTQFVKPGNLINLKAKSLNINNTIELFVEQTTIIGNRNSERYILTCVMKEVYNFADVKNIFE